MRTIVRQAYGTEYATAGNYIGGCADIADILTGDTVQMNCIDFFKMRAQQYYEAGMQKQYEECFSIIDELIRMSGEEESASQNQA